MSELEKYILANGYTEIDVMNFLMDRSVISDMAVKAKDVADDLEAVVYLRKAYFP